MASPASTPGWARHPIATEDGAAAEDGACRIAAEAGVASPRGAELPRRYLLRHDAPLRATTRSHAPLRAVVRLLRQCCALLCLTVAVFVCTLFRCYFFVMRHDALLLATMRSRALLLHKAKTCSWCVPLPNHDAVCYVSVTLFCCCSFIPELYFAVGIMCLRTCVYVLTLFCLFVCLLGLRGAPTSKVILRPLQGFNTES